MRKEFRPFYFSHDIEVIAVTAALDYAIILNYGLHNVKSHLLAEMFVAENGKKL